MAEKEDISQDGGREQDQIYKANIEDAHQRQHYLNEKKPNPTLSGHFAAKKSFLTE